MKRTIAQCPVCDAPLAVIELQCRACGTTLRGEFAPPGCAYCSLPDEQMRFLELFLRCRGNLRDVERSLGLSYPTVRARLDALLSALGYTAVPEPEPGVQRHEILEALRDGRLTAAEAIALLEER
jgi:hypothetical protein